jgi:hypothetical protein
VAIDVLDSREAIVRFRQGMDLQRHRLQPCPIPLPRMYRQQSSLLPIAWFKDEALYPPHRQRFRLLIPT